MESVAPLTSPAATVPLARRVDFALGAATVRPSLRTVEGPRGSMQGEPRVIEVLVALAEAQGQVLSRDDLLQRCWGGRIVGTDAINRAIAEVRRIADVVGAGFKVETVPRIGYRLTGVDWGHPAGDVAPRTVAELTRRALIAGGATAGLLAAGGAAWLFRRGSRTEALVARGRQLAATGDRTRAEAAFRAAIAHDPGQAEAWGWLACVAQDQAAAREAAQRALRLDPREPNARVLLAYQARDLESWTDYEDVLIDVLREYPANIEALNQLTFFYQGMGRCIDSWNLNERSFRAEPFSPIPIHRRALKHWIFGRVGQADQVADEAMRLFPRNPNVWNARMVIYAFTGRGAAGLALLSDTRSRPANLTEPSIASWHAALQAIATRTPGEVRQAIDLCTKTATEAPGLAANAIMAFSYLGELDAAYDVAKGLFESRGPIVQRTRSGNPDLYAPSTWGRTQFLFIPATAAFRADPRFPALCGWMGHLAYWRERGIWPDPAMRGALDPAKLA